MTKLILLKNFKNYTVVTILLIFAVVSKSTTASPLPDFGNETRQILSLNNEILIGKIWLHQLHNADFISKDLINNHYINHLGHMLLSNAAHGHESRKFNFFTIDHAEINAFAFFGGNIGVFAGLINITETESELAAILAHEISHITQQHSARQLLQQKKLMPITIVEAAAALALGVPDLVMPVLGNHIQQMLNFSRENEQEADRIGIQLLSRSIFDPKAMATIFTRFKQLNTDYQKTPEYLLTHPMFDSRIPDALNRTEKLNYKQYIDSLDYNLIKARVNTILTDNKTNALITIKQRIKSKKYHNLTAIKYQQALLLQELQKYLPAEQIFKQLAEENPNNLTLQLSWLQSLSHTQPTLVTQKLKNLHLANPECLPGNVLYAQSLLNSKNFAATIDLLTPYNKNNLHELIEEPVIYKILISCYQNLNQIDLSLLTLAKLSVINNQLTIAEQQLQQAIKIAAKKNLHKIKKFQQQLQNFMLEIKELNL